MPNDRRKDWGRVSAELDARARAQHPAATPDAPRDTASWPPEVQRAPRLPTIQPPPPSRRSTAPQWAVGIVSVLTALGTVLGGVGYMVTEYRKSEAAGALESRARFDRLEASLRVIIDDQQDRDIATLAVLCALNGGPPARNVRCPPTACAEREQARDGGFIGPICKATVDWPPVRRSP